MDFLLPTIALTAAGVLAHAGVGHLRHRDALEVALHRQALFGAGPTRIVRLGLGPLEIALAVGAVAALTSGIGAVAAGAGLALLGVGFLTFLLVLARFRPAAPCGCADDGRTAGPLEAGRAAVVLAGGLGLPAGAERWAALAGSEATTVVVAAIACSVAVELAASAPAPRLVPR